MENVIRSNFPLIEVPHNFFFRVQIGLKCAVEYFASCSGHFRKSSLENGDEIFLQIIKNIIII